MYRPGTKPERVRRFAFVDVMRAAAAILVLVAHFVELYLYQPQLVAAAIGAPPSTIVAPDWLRTFVLRSLNPGGLAVALFFLIGGFLAPMALARRPALPYLAERLFRIYPAWFAAFALSCLALFVAWSVWRRPLPYAAGDYLANLLLAPDLTIRQTIVGPLWTLEVQMKFFVAVAVFAAPLRRGAIWPAFAWAALTLALYAATSVPCIGKDDSCFLSYGAFYLFSGWEAMYVLYCFIGIVFYAHWSGRLGTGAAIAAALCLFGLFVASFKLSGLFERRLPAGLASYFLAMVLMAGAYALRHRIRSTRWLDFIAQVSYPLYALHMVVGLVLLRLMEDWGIPYLLSLPATVAITLALAWIVARRIEQPGVKLGRTFAARLGAAPERTQP